MLCQYANVGDDLAFTCTWQADGMLARMAVGYYFLGRRILCTGMTHFYHPKHLPGQPILTEFVNSHTLRRWHKLKSYSICAEELQHQSNAACCAVLPAC